MTGTVEILPPGQSPPRRRWASTSVWTPADDAEATTWLEPVTDQQYTAAHDAARVWTGARLSAALTMLLPFIGNPSHAERLAAVNDIATHQQPMTNHDRKQIL